MPSEQALSCPPTAADIVAYDAATLAHKARMRRKCSICYNDRRHCFCEAIYGSESDTEHEQTTNHSVVETAGMINHDHANHGFRPHRPLASGDGDACDAIGEQDHITEARVSTDDDIANSETLISRAYNTMRATTRYLLEDAMLYSSSSSSSSSGDGSNVDESGVPNDTVEARQLIGTVIGSADVTGGVAAGAVEVADVEERHMDAGESTTNAESHEYIVGANGNLPRAAEGPSPSATRLLRGLGVTPTVTASYLHSRLPTLSVTVNVGDDANNNDIEIDLSPNARSRGRDDAIEEMEREIGLTSSTEALKSSLDMTSSSVLTSSSREISANAQENANAHENTDAKDIIGMAGARDLAFAAVADALASEQLDRIQPVAAEPHRYHHDRRHQHHHQHQELADSFEYDADKDLDHTYNNSETYREFTHEDSVFEHSIFHEDTRTFEFEDEEEEDWVDATPSTTASAASSEIERYAEINRQNCETNTPTTPQLKVRK